MGPLLQCPAARTRRYPANSRPRSGRVDRAAGEATGSKDQGVSVGDGATLDGVELWPRSHGSGR
jgi:hypothetical protein